MLCGLFGQQPCHLQAPTRGGVCDSVSVLHISALQTPLQRNGACDEETRRKTFLQLMLCLPPVAEGRLQIDYSEIQGIINIISRFLD